MKNINEVEANDIDIKPFKVKDKLNPEFFNDEGQLNSQIRMRLLDIADDFVKTLEIKWIKPSDIVLTGSIANYNWSKFSDVDIHVIYKFSDVYEKTEFVKDYFNSKKELWNNTHDELTIKDFPVELSVEDSDNPAQSTGVYSLEKNKWVKEPENMNDSELNKEYIKDFCAKQMTKLDDLFEEMDGEKDRKKLETLSNKVEAIYTKLKNMRAEGLATKEKEMSTGNIIWKIIKHMGYISKLWEYINKVYDRRNTIDEKKILRITEAQAKKINEVYDASKLAKFGPVKRYFNYLNLELPLKGEYQLNPDDPKDKQIVCKCLTAVGSPKLKAQIHDKYRSGCIFGADLVTYLGNYQNRNMLRNAIVKEKGDFARQQEYTNIPPEDYTPRASKMGEFVGMDDISSLNEAAMPEFNLQTLSSIKSFAGRLKYCKQMLGPTFGSGSSRVIFEIDDNKVLKLAKNQKGIAQNEFEDDTSRYGRIVVKVFECADDYTWLVEENCIPAKEKDFEQILGMPFETYCDLVKHSFNRYCRNGRQANTYTLSPIECDRLLDQLYEQDEYGFIPQLFNLMGDYQLPWGDLTRISTYGMVNRDGEPEIVVIDSGLSEEILDTYYRRK